MMEEHLDDGYQNSEISTGFAELEAEIWELEKKKLASHNRQLKDKLQKTITLLRSEIQRYQHIILFNRRRAKQRLRRRQCILRDFFLRSLMETQIRFVEMLPLTIEPQMLLENMINKSQSRETVATDYNIAQNSYKDEDSTQFLSFYNDIVLKFTPDQWLDTFHMSKCVFDSICDRLKTSLDNINMNLENWIAMCIYTFATGSKFCSVAILFNVEQKFVRQSLFKFSECLLNEFSNKMCMPNSLSELDSITNGFNKASNMMPSVAGVLNIFMLPNLCNCSHCECIKVQVCIDNSLFFRKVETTSHKPTMFLRSPNEISPYSKTIDENFEVPYFIVAPDHYPLRNWLMQKYDKPCEPWEHNFNKACANLNIYREVSLKKLFGRWHILNLTECMLPESKSFIVKACCLLHNILEKKDEYFSLEWCKNFDPSNYEYILTSTRRFDDSTTAMEKRDLIAKCMSSTNT